MLESAIVKAIPLMSHVIAPFGSTEETRKAVHWAFSTHANQSTPLLNLSNNVAILITSKMGSKFSVIAAILLLPLFHKNKDPLLYAWTEI